MSAVVVRDTHAAPLPVPGDSFPCTRSAEEYTHTITHTFRDCDRMMPSSETGGFEN